MAMILKPIISKWQTVKVKEIRQEYIFFRTFPLSRNFCKQFKITSVKHSTLFKTTQKKNIFPHYATMELPNIMSRKVAGLRPGEVNEFYYLPYLSSCIGPWGLLSLLTEMSIRSREL
jgi:hypothetical protein